MTTGAASWGFDAEVQAYVERVENFFAGDLAGFEITDQRRQYVDFCRGFAVSPPPGIDIRDATLDGRAGPVPIRIYRPSSQGPQPCLLFIHGGGWVFGDLDSHHSECADLAEATGTTVIAVAYRLAPEHPYPAALEDAWDVLTVIATEAAAFGIDAERIGVGGDSAGGNIAAGMALRARDRGGPDIAAQFLIYPALGGNDGLASYTEFADAPLLTTAGMKLYAMLYCGSEWFTDDPLLAPLRADDLSGLPPAFLQPAGVDPLRDDSVAYEERLRRAGVETDLVIEDGLPHSFLRARHSTEKGRAAFARLCAAIRSRLSH
ncbi:MAG: alpha/beta hydrolase [Rhodospirillales bacterium]